MVVVPMPPSIAPAYRSMGLPGSLDVKSQMYSVSPCSCPGCFMTRYLSMNENA